MLSTWCCFPVSNTPWRRPIKFRVLKDTCQSSIHHTCKYEKVELASFVPDFYCRLTSLVSVMWFIISSTVLHCELHRQMDGGCLRHPSSRKCKWPLLLLQLLFNSCAGSGTSHCGFHSLINVWTGQKENQVTATALSLLLWYKISETALRRVIEDWDYCSLC